MATLPEHLAPEPVLVQAACAHPACGCGEERVPFLGLNLRPAGLQGPPGACWGFCRTFWKSGAQGPADAMPSPQGLGSSGAGEACTQGSGPPAP